MYQMHIFFLRKKSNEEQMRQLSLKLTSQRKITSRAASLGEDSRKLEIIWITQKLVVDGPIARQNSQFEYQRHLEAESQKGGGLSRLPGFVFHWKKRCSLRYVQVVLVWVLLKSI